jgi:hypothetical protein
MHIACHALGRPKNPVGQVIADSCPICSNNFRYSLCGEEMNDTTKIANQLIEDFNTHFAGTISKNALNSTVAYLEGITEEQLKAATSFSANGSLASLLFYVKATCQINGGKLFNGSAWGVSFPGGGALFGDVYLADGVALSQLYDKTGSFKFYATPVYTAFYFYDSGDNLLGHFQAGSVSTVTGGGGGAGGWS